MPTSDTRRVYVWAFMSRHDDPVVAGVLFPSSIGNGLAFQYGTTYLARRDAVSLGPDIPLSRDPFPPIHEHGMPSSIRDAMPDSWGRFVIQRQAGLGTEDRLPDVAYMLESGSDRVGAIDFQASAVEYAPRLGGGTLQELADGSAIVEMDDQAGPELTQAIRNSLGAAGGSQPKAFVVLDGRHWLAKFPTGYDRQSPLIKAERAAIHIARNAGIAVTDAKMLNVEGRGETLLMQRFDRRGAHRRMVLSGHTVSDQHMAAGGSYPKLVESLTSLSAHPPTVGRDLFERIAFRIVMRIDDDHLRNVAVFWDGEHAEFTPAFDLSPDLAATPRGLTDIGDGDRQFNLDALVRKHSYYRLTRSEAASIAQRMTDAVVDNREDAADVAHMTKGERALLVSRTATPALIGGFRVAAGRLAVTRTTGRHTGTAREAGRAAPSIVETPSKRGQCS